MPYKVYYSNMQVTANAGFSRVAHLPCIFDSRPGYHRLSSSYLIDRGLGIWHPPTQDTKAYGLVPSDQTIRNYAHWLANFLEWTEIRNVDLLTCTPVEHIYGRYKAELLSGTWSRDNVALSITTVTLRVQQACEFVVWLVEKGHRPPFTNYESYFASKTLSPNVEQRRHRTNRSSFGRTPKRPSKRLQIPTDEQLRVWLDKVYKKYGNVRGLMCETILLCAVRRTEVASWRTDTLPDDPQQWHINRRDAPAKEQLVRVNIKYGTKGRDFGKSHGDKIGPERDIWIPISLAWRLHEYRTGLRSVALRKWVKSAPSLEEKRQRISDSVHLFLDESTGRRLTSKDVYNTWTGVEVPFPGWSPHQGRHWWACSVLWIEMKKHERLRDLGVNTASALIESSAMSIIRLQIQPQLGHAHESTTIIYLRWVSDMLGTCVSIPYEAELSVPKIGIIASEELN